jgi:AcrR family transcriptional regulator
MTVRKEKYAVKTMEVFRQFGLHLSIDEIADRAGVTKKTLYNHFDSKEGLLMFCLQTFVNDLEKKIAIMYAEEINAIDGFKSGIYGMGEVFHSMSPVFFNDLRKMFPEISGTQHKAGFGSFLEGMKKNLLKGKREKLYRQDIDIEMISRFFITSVVSFFISSVMTRSDYSAKDYFTSMIDYHLHAVVTPKGQRLLEDENSNSQNTDRQ